MSCGYDRSVRLSIISGAEDPRISRSVILCTCRETRTDIPLTQVNSSLFRIVQDRAIWANILEEQRRHFPFPAHLALSPPYARLDSEQLRGLARDIHRFEADWLLPRAVSYVPPHPSSLERRFTHEDAKSIFSIEILLDRWLLCIYKERVIELWELPSSGAAIVNNGLSSEPLARHHTSLVFGTSGFCASAATHMDDTDGMLTVAVVAYVFASSGVASRHVTKYATVARSANCLR